MFSLYIIFNSWKIQFDVCEHQLLLLFWNYLVILAIDVRLTFINIQATFHHTFEGSTSTTHLSTTNFYLCII